MRVGIDLVSVEQVRRAIADHGDHYLSRVFTPRELAETQSEPHRLAARFAAKEATIKALGATDEGLGWSSIGVAGDAAGRPGLELTGAAAELAQRRGIASLSVSLTHTGDHAAAVVLAGARS
ncbi:MAG: holo-ACP synthase [Solirubrobacteraceae bacterium]|jgi:holo-[acyl-carrier protein] synthase